MTFARPLGIALLACCLSGCVLTKFVTTPMRLGGATLCLGGAVVSIAPVVGNPANAALRKADSAVNTAADEIDEVPL
ncbi:MAG: hypothetical protein E6J69_09490 [Deltaproteobacteria bacterium]|nr:MAG: hypothetical protein E6J69_09490 [Deltaproteobacteria bacterium]TMB44052.1 MAG: hypothetical protein E6J55_11005 [Deltaproteobacteria bacterium]